MKSFACGKGTTVIGTSSAVPALGKKGGCKKLAFVDPTGVKILC